MCRYDDEDTTEEEGKKHNFLHLPNAVSHTAYENIKFQYLSIYEIFISRHVSRFVGDESTIKELSKRSALWWLCFVSLICPFYIFFHLRNRRSEEKQHHQLVSSSDYRPTMGWRLSDPIICLKDHSCLCNYSDLVVIFWLVSIPPVIWCFLSPCDEHIHLLHIHTILLQQTTKLPCLYHFAASPHRWPFWLFNHHFITLRIIIILSSFVTFSDVLIML